MYTDNNVDQNVRVPLESADYLFISYNSAFTIQQNIFEKRNFNARNLKILIICKRSLYE